METLRELIKSKTFWTGIGTIGFGVYLLIQGDYAVGVSTVAGGLGMVFIRDTLRKVIKKG